MSGLPEEDLSCPVCCDIFRDPVLLSCSHSFCRSCLQRCWKTQGSHSCPVCRRRSSKRSPPSNLALRNLSEAFLQVRGQRAAAAESGVLCRLHGEKLKLFCLEDKQLMCVVCQTSKMHKSHDCSPTEEAAQDCKDELNTALKTLQDKLDALSKARLTSVVTLEHIKSQAQLIQKRMKDQFVKLHQFLYEEEKDMISALKEEEEQRIQAMKEKDVDIAGKISSLSETIRTIEQEMAAEDMTLLQNFRATIERTQSTLQEPEWGSGTLMDEAKYLGNLKHRVWEKMQGVAQYTPLTLDPNTAHPCLSLSDDLTTLQYSSPTHGLPNNPERFHISAEVLGYNRLGSGRHCWEVETGDNEDWILGLASESVKRNEEIPARPENGFWTLCLRDGEYRAMTSPPTPLTVSRKPQRVRVQLDWDRGELSLTDPADNTPLYTFTHAFTGRVLPYFYTQSKHPLRILPLNASVTADQERLQLRE